MIRIEFKKGSPKLLHPEWTVDKMPISTDGSDPKSWDPKNEGSVAAPGNHPVIFENDILRVQSVSVSAMSEEPYHNHPYPSVLVVDQVPREVDRNRSGAEFDLSSFAKFAPYAFVQPPESLHSVKNIDTSPIT